jgi:uncharacterized protein (DUF1800 family)
MDAVTGSSSVLTPRDSAFHVLNRLAYGPRPGEVDRIAKTGVQDWIKGQLASDRPNDRALTRVEPRYAILQMEPRELAARYAEERRERQREKSGKNGREMEEQPPMASPPSEGRRLAGELQQLALIRATAADFQLREVMVDFWTNHFNVNLRKGLDRALVPAYIEGTIRPNSLGRFEDLLIATAKSPAMLFYLDNALSVAPGAEPPARRRFGRFPAPQGGRAQPKGINENYARELLELHTLGVDGGYTQQDVINVARILTGWGIGRASQAGGFEFHDWAHDEGEKVVLDVRFPAGHGMDEGVRLLKMLANHPATMHHVSRKLCARFVSDEPPDGCVDDAVAAWERSRGDIRQVLLAIFQSPEFWAPAAMRSKIKTPLEFMVSAMRAIGAEPDTTPRVAQAIARLGQPLYLQASPAGYPESQEEWVNSGALLQRMNLAVGLAGGTMPGATVDLDRLTPVTVEYDRLLDAIDRTLFEGTMSAHTREAIANELRDEGDPERGRALAIGLALGSPEFQRQ